MFASRSFSCVPAILAGFVVLSPLTVAHANPVQAVLVIGPAAPASTKSAIPGAIPGGAGSQADPRFTNFNNKIYRSPTSNRWVVVATTNLTPTTTDQVLVIGSGLSLVGGAVSAREGITATTTGDLLNFSLLSVPRINDSEQWAMGYRLSGGGADQDRLVKWDGTALTTLFKAGDTIPPAPDAFFGGSFNSANITNSGGVGFLATAFVAGTNDSIYTASGATALVTVGTDVPTGQVNDETAAWSDIDTNGFTQDATGTHWLALGTLGTLTTQDRVVVVDGVVKIQEGSVITGSAFTSTVSAFTSAIMESNGDWFAIGTNADSQRWVVRNGVVIAAGNQPIVPGSTELWETFRDVKGNNAGNWVISGNTNASTLTDDVLVLNGQRVLARESDPVDLNADGTFAGSLYVHLIQDNDVLNNDGYYYFASRLKSTDMGTAGAGGSNNASFLRVLACPADYNNSGAVSVQDIFDFLSGWFAGNLVADINRSGTLTVQDIFDFLSAWFGGC